MEDNNPENREEGGNIEMEVDNNFGGKFINCNGCTHMKTVTGLKKVFNFSLKKIGNIISLTENVPGKWLFELCSESLRDGTNCSKCNVALDSNCFRNQDSLRKQLGPQCRNMFLFMDAKVVPALLSSYYDWIQKEYEDTESRTYYIADYIGYHHPDTWILSNEVQIKDCQLIPEVNRKYMLLDGKLKESTLSFNQSLLHKEYLDRVLFKLLDYSESFGCNEDSFLQVFAFSLMRLWRATQKENAAEESKYCCIRGASLSIGKTTALLIVALSAGIPNSNHRFFLAGGDGQQTGTSSLVQKQSLSMTNQIVILNEIALGSMMANTLTNTHDKMLGGSVSSGLLDCKASVIGSSNSNEHERLKGRMVFVEFKKGKYSDDLYRILKNEFLPMIEENPGLAIAWVCQYGRILDKVFPRAQYVCHEIVLKYVRDEQRRLTWAMAGNLLFVYAMYISANKDLDEIKMFKHIIKLKVGEDNSFFARLTRNVKQLITTKKKEVFTWINPITKFKDDSGRMVDAIGIRSTMLSQLDEITIADLKVLLNGYGKKCWSINASFSTDPNGTLDDLKKNKSCKTDKCYKLPWKELPVPLVSFLEESLGLEKKGVGVEVPVSSHINKIAECDVWAIQQMYLSFKRNIRIRLQAPDADNVVDAAAETLSPIRKRKYLDMTQEFREVFDSGVATGREQMAMMAARNLRVEIEEESNHGNKAVVITVATPSNGSVVSAVATPSNGAVVSDVATPSNGSVVSTVATPQ